MKNRILSVLLCLAMLLTMTLGTMPVHTKAVSYGAEQKSAEEQPITPENTGLANEDTTDAGKKFFTAQMDAIYQHSGYAARDRYTVCTATSQDQTAMEEATEALRQGMMVRETEISVDLALSEVNPSDAWYQIWEMVMEHTGEPEAGDYIARHWSGCSGDISGYTTSEGTFITLTYYITYYTDATQEAELDAAVDTLLAELNLWNATDYEKVCGIYDYMCQNISYDYTNLEDTDYTLKYSAYAAMINKTAVCQGYALLFYRLALELGVDTRLISGTTNDGGHAWNIVELNNQYYNLDTTWDRAWYAAGLPYEWFLRCSENFPNHYPNEDYLTEEFQAAYPMSQTDYVPAAELASGTCGDNLTWVLTDDGVLTISGTGDMDDYDSFRDAPWCDYVSQITTAVMEDGVTNIGDFAFRFCSELTGITIPDSVTSIGDCAFHYCSSLESITIPDSVTEINDYAFQSCSSLKSINIGDGVTSIGDSAFALCSSLESAIIGDSVTRIGISAFALCSSLESITIPESVTSIGNEAFFGCSSLNEIYFEGDAPGFGWGVFDDVTATAYYPAGNETWMADVMQDYGGTITWIAYCTRGHSWLDATCAAPKTCALCGVTEGAALGHNYVDGACEHCGEADPDAVAILMGDANNDGIINYLDAMLIAQYYVGDIEEGDLNVAAADVNGDGVINYLDAMMVAQYYVGDIDSFK